MADNNSKRKYCCSMLALLYFTLTFTATATFALFYVALNIEVQQKLITASLLLQSLSWQLTLTAFLLLCFCKLLLQLQLLLLHYLC